MTATEAAVTADSRNRVVERLRQRAREDADLAETLRFLAESDDIAPFSRPSDAVLAGARRVNARRLAARQRELAGRALSTRQVFELVGTMSDRRAVDRRRHRGRLLGVRAGATTLHPDWQFDRRRSETRPGLERVLAALAQVVADPLAADALMVAPRGEVGGRSIADVFADGDVDLAVQLILTAADQS